MISNLLASITLTDAREEQTPLLARATLRRYYRSRLISSACSRLALWFGVNAENL